MVDECEFDIMESEDDREPDNSWVMCQDCHGEGVDLDYLSNTCRHCGGEGGYHEYEDM